MVKDRTCQFTRRCCEGFLRVTMTGTSPPICDIVGKFETSDNNTLGAGDGGSARPVFLARMDRRRNTSPRTGISSIIAGRAGNALKFMWSPKGLPGLEKYYPGDTYVDFIGLSVFGLQPYDRDNFGHDRDFAAALKPGYDLVAKFNKPICVAELGYVGRSLTMCASGPRKF